MSCGLGLVLILGSACSQVSYVTHVGIGQMRVLRAREALTPERIAQLSPEEQRGLAALKQALALGESLGLGHSTSYRHLIERSEDESIRVVVVAPAQRLEPVTWWFPIVGRVAYRGYFDPARAQVFAQGLARQGFDTYVRPALLYSTLGWFDDPVPRALLRWPPTAIVETIVHELVHEAIFVKNDTAYNEALATFIAHHAALEHFAEQPLQIEAVRHVFADKRQFAQLLEDLSGELNALYEREPSAEDARSGREVIFQRYQQQRYRSLGWQTLRYEGFQGLALSNAYVLANRTYLGNLPCFERELAELEGDLRAFVREQRTKPKRHTDTQECAPSATGEAPQWVADPSSS